MIACIHFVLHAGANKRNNKSNKSGSHQGHIPYMTLSCSVDKLATTISTCYSHTGDKTSCFYIVDYCIIYLSLTY